MEPVATIAAALIGGVIGSLGAQWLGERYRRRQDVQATRRAVAVRRLVTQDTLESLWFRIDNLAHKGGHGVMVADYYELSSVYVLAFALAQERLLTVDGAYAEMNVLGNPWRTISTKPWKVCNKPSVTKPFPRRRSTGAARALADLLLKWDGVWRTLSYAEFAETVRLETSLAVIEPALRFINNLSPPHGT